MWTTKPVVKEALLALNFCGINPLNCNKWSNVKAVTLVLLVTVFTFEAILNVALSPKDLDSIYNFTTTVGVYQLLAKILALVIKRHQIGKLLDDMDKFWQFTDCRTSPELKQRIKNIYSLINRAGKYAVLIVTAFIIMISISSLLQRTLPVGMYHPHDLSNKTNFPIAFLFEFGTVLWMVFAYIGFDYLLFAFIVYLYWEFQVLKESIILLPKVDLKEVSRELGSIVDQHNVVLGCVNKVGNIYSLVLLNNLVSSILCLSTGLVTLTMTSFANPANFLKVAVYLVPNFSQLFVYCLLGTILTLGCEEVANAVWESDWFKIKEPRLMKTLVLVLQRSQKEEKIKAGKLLDVNLKTFTKILNSVLSFFTVLQAVYRK